ncbi:rhomboid family intramembrane serine protease [Zooshikella harenae]|uniref:Rhomboid family intramembrane serine protease n=1 Tax=Zooshikella harenae TaxID=2827238 RepID=A0ABS5Z7D4_9GAMM|nr:rhomboid family intramembrane serine protease [Zooshikella harenae]MBU2709959.1 rhomboid family intramembrane serine protease [Zooshikella harenae]
MLRLLEVPAEEDLRSFSLYLYHHGVKHKITEESGQQVLWLVAEDQQQQVTDWFQQVQCGELDLSRYQAVIDNPQALRTQNHQHSISQISYFPMTAFFLVINLFVAAVTGLGSNYQVVSWLTFVDFTLIGNHVLAASLGDVFTSHQYWRLLSPIFLHFGWLHIIFNMLWLYVLGRRIETKDSSKLMFGLVLFVGFLSNFGQYLMSIDHPIFGGFSGVVYGLLGYCWVREKLANVNFFIPQSIYMFMIVWLVIGYSDILAVVGFGNVANTAHTVGLLAGCLFAVFRGRYNPDNALRC